MAGRFARIAQRVRNVITAGDVFVRPGNTSTGAVAVTNADQAMRLSTVWGCVRLLSGQVASLPLQVYDVGDDGTRRIEDRGELYRVLAIRPNRLQSSYEFREMLTSWLLLRGVAYAQIIRDGRGRVRELWPLHPDQTEVNWDSDRGQLVYTVTLYHTATGDPQTKRFREDEVLHVRGLYSDILNPISPITAQAMTLDSNFGLSEHQRTTFARNAARPGGYLQAETNVGERTALRYLDLFNREQAGPTNSGKTLFLPKGMTWNRLQISNHDAQFIETYKLSRREIAGGVFGVPPSMLGDTEHSRYATATAESEAFVKFSLRPLLQRFEEAFRRDLVEEARQPRTEINLDTSALLRGDNKSTAEYLRTLVQSGLMTPNEARSVIALDRSEAEGADSLYLQMNQAPLEDLSTEDETPQPTEADAATIDEIAAGALLRIAEGG